MERCSKKVNSQYRSETLLKQISLQVFLNYCINILVVGFAYFLSDFSRSRSSDLKAFCKKSLFLDNFRIQRKTLVPESSFKVTECFKTETLTKVFLCKFQKVFGNVLQKLCFVEPLKRFAFEIANFQATSSPILKEAVVFNCLSTKFNKTWHFLIHPPLISFKMVLTKNIFDYHSISEKSQIGGVEDMKSQRVLKKANRNSRIN